MSDPRNFLLTSDYPLDKVVYLHEGSITAGAGALQQDDISHDLPFVPLGIMNWSTTSNFSVTYEENSGPIAPPNGYSPYLYGVGLESYADKFKVSLTNYISGSSATIYYRIYAYAPSTATNTLTGTSDGGSSFVLNTDFNYTKLFDSGVTAVPDTFSTPFSEPIAHDLGFKPQAQIWVERTGLVQQVAQSVSYSGIVCRVTDSHVYIEADLAGAADVHWRIYADE